MKKELLTVKELAVELRMSVKSIQHAYRKEETPMSGWAPWRGRSREGPTGNGTQETKPHAPSQWQLDTVRQRARRAGLAGGA